MLIVEVQGWGDFDMPYTHSVWALDTKQSLSDLGLSSTEFANDRNSDNIIKRLKELGFKKIKNQNLTFGSNL